MKKIRKIHTDSQEREIKLGTFDVVCYNTSSDMVKYITPINTRVEAIYNIPSAGTYNILGYRDATRHFDTSQLEKIVIDGEQKETISHSHTFTTNGLHTIEYYFKKEITVVSLERMFDEANQSITAAELKYLDVSGLNKVFISSMFCFCQFCYYLETVVGLSLLNLSICTSIANIFNSCYVLNDLDDISNWDISHVETLRSSFSLCRKLTTLDVTKWNTSAVTTMYNLFQGCSGLTTVGDLTDWDVSKVTTFYHLFHNCPKLTFVGDLSNWNTSACTEMTSMFYQCSGLTSIGDLSGWNTSACTNMGWMFYECRKITTLGNLDNWDVSHVTNMKSMFYNCAALTSIGDLSLWNTSACTDMSYMFYQCLYLPSLGDLGDWDVSHVSSMIAMFDNDNEFFTFGDINKWNTSACTDMGWMFYGCRRLSAITVSDWDVSHVSSMKSMFWNCNAIINLDLSKWDVSNVTDFTWMFESCDNLESVGDLSNWNVSAGTLFESTFNVCPKLTSLGDISNWDMRNATKIHWMFHSMPWTTANLHNWETPKVTTVQNLFSQCGYLETVDLTNMTLSACTSNDGLTRSPFSNDSTVNLNVTKIILSWKYFLGPGTTYAFSRVNKWTRESMIESFYTNQFISEGVPGRDISVVKTVKLEKSSYDRLTQEDLDLFLTVGLNVTY